jgi:hypothetical protein
MDPVGAGHLAAGRSASGEPVGEEGLTEPLDSAMAEALWIDPGRDEDLSRQG